MKPEWLKRPELNHWTSHIGPYTAAVSRTQFGSYTWTVSDKTQVVRSGNVSELEVAQMAAERATEELGQGAAG